MGGRVSRWALLAGAGLLLAAVAAGLMFGRGAVDVKPGVEAASVAVPAPRPAETAAWPAPAAGPAQASAATASSAAGAAANADPHALFMQAVKEARERPQPPPPPAIAKAKTFPEAFAAMQAAQREADKNNSPPGTAALNPFAPAAK